MKRTKKKQTAKAHALVGNIDLSRNKCSVVRLDEADCTDDDDYLIEAWEPEGPSDNRKQPA